MDGVLFTHELIVAADAMSTGINTGLYVDTIELGLSSGAARDICLGLDTPERPGLTQFKESMGFPVVHLPARSSIPAPVAAVIRAAPSRGVLPADGDTAPAPTPGATA